MRSWLIKVEEELSVKNIAELIDTVPQIGRVEWIGVRPARGDAMRKLERVEINPDYGLAEDRYNGRSGKRHVSLLQAEHLAVIAACLHKDSINPELLRRNLVVSGINLIGLKGKVIQIGDTDIEITGACHPCSRMEQQLGPGGYNAMRGHGGMTGRVHKGGVITLGDAVSYRATAEHS